MLERRRASEAFEVRPVFEDQIPVGGVARGRKGIAPQAGDLRGQEDDRVDKASDDHQGERWQEPSRAAHPKRPEARAATALVFE